MFAGIDIASERHMLARLDGEFAGRRADLLAQRRAQSRRINRGADLDFSLEEIAARIAGM